jgi:hypothetical protein
MDHSEIAENKIIAKEAASILEAGGILQITLEGTRLTLTSEDIREYARYRQIGLACKKVNSSVTVLGPTDWFHKYKPKVISK